MMPQLGREDIEDDLTEETDEREEVGIGGLPSEAQLVLLCLDYLRDLRRAYPEEELATAEGIDANFLSLSIYALSRCFLRPQHLRMNNGEQGNDAWMDRPNTEQSSVTKPTFSSSGRVYLPDINAINEDIIADPGDDDDSDEHENEDYPYDDAHTSNSHRFYPLNGLASGPSLKGPLTLGEITAAGLAGLGARSRSDAEREMVKSPLFEQFVGAVRAKGFFRDPETETPKETPEEEKERQQKAAEIYEERFRKVVSKFRTKLASKAQQQEGATSPISVGGPLSGNLLAMSAADRQTRRRQRRIQLARVKKGSHTKARVSNGSPIQDSKAASNAKATESGTSVISSLTKKLAPKSPTKRSLAARHSAVDLEEAERLKIQGNSCMQKKEYKQAAEAYTAALKLSPAGPQSHVYFSNRAAALLSMKKFHDAILDSERSLALKPDYGKAHARLGLAHFLLGNYRQAMEAYTVSLKYEPDNKSSKNYLEKAAKRLAKRESQGDGRVGSSYSVVSEWDKSEMNKSFRTSAMSVSSLEDQEERKKLVDQKEAEKFKSRGNSYMASRDYVAAIEAYTTAIQLSGTGSTSHVYYSNRAAALCYLERYEEAEADSERSLSLNPSYGKAHARLGLSRFFMGDYEGAVEAYSSALQYDPDNAASKSYLAKAKSRLQGLASGGDREDTVGRRPSRDEKIADKSDDLENNEESIDTFTNHPRISVQAKKMMDDPEMQRMAKKAMADPSMVETMMEAMKEKM